jgi:hypothetical protein
MAKDSGWNTRRFSPALATPLRARDNIRDLDLKRWPPCADDPLRPRRGCSGSRRPTSQIGLARHHPQGRLQHLGPRSARRAAGGNDTAKRKNGTGRLLPVAASPLACGGLFSVIVHTELFVLIVRICSPPLLLALRLFGLQRRHVDREAILHIGLEQSVVSFVDLLNRDHFNVSGDPMLAAKVEHLLRLANSADH